MGGSVRSRILSFFLIYLINSLGLNEIYVRFRFPYRLCFFQPCPKTLLLGVKCLKMAASSDLDAISFVGCFDKI